MTERLVRITDAIACGAGRPLLWMAGPCVIESHGLTLEIAGKLAETAKKLQLPLIFKASFDKANRSSGKSFRGPGLEAGLTTLAEVKRHMPVRALLTTEEIEARAKRFAELRKREAESEEI